jgi:hypothetical protein
MNLYLLDAGGAGLVFIALIIFMIVAFIAEALVMVFLKYNIPGKAFLDSLVINLVSLGAGYLVVAFAGSLDFTHNVILDYISIYLLTVVAEFVTLYLLNRSKPWGKTLLTAFIINLVTYIILFILQQL